MFMMNKYLSLVLIWVWSKVVLSYFVEPPSVRTFGISKLGQEVQIYTIRNKDISTEIMTLGATIVNLLVPDKDGKLEDIVLGFDNVSDYESEKNQYFGCTVGRVSNRIAKGIFKLDDKEYSLVTNNGPNHLHGGAVRSLDKVVWKAESYVCVEGINKGQGVTLTYTSEDGEEGYPGNLNVSVTFFITAESNSVHISYQATTDAPTPVSLTNHAYFNLCGEGKGTILDHILQINAEHYTPTDDTLIPTGEIAHVDGTALDFRRPIRIGTRMDRMIPTAANGYDHNFVLVKGDAIADDDHPTMTLAAILSDPESRRRLFVYTQEPGLQFYTGNYLKGDCGKGGKPYFCRSALCLETQHFPDALNHSNFPSIILHPNEEYRSKTIYSFDQ